MAYYRDLSPCDYFFGRAKLLAVGWLEGGPPLYTPGDYRALRSAGLNAATWWMQEQPTEGQCPGEFHQKQQEYARKLHLECFPPLPARRTAPVLSPTFRSQGPGTASSRSVGRGYAASGRTSPTRYCPVPRTTCIGCRQPRSRSKSSAVPRDCPCRGPGARDSLSA